MLLSSIYGNICIVLILHHNIVSSYNLPGNVDMIELIHKGENADTFIFLHICITLNERGICMKDNNTNTPTTEDKELKRTIIINKMYVGRYLDFGENIGHEAINLKRSSNEKYYIYLNSKGLINRKYVKGAKIVDINNSELRNEKKRQIDVILVYPINSRVYQVLALAKDVSVLASAIYPSYKKDKDDIGYFTDINARRDKQKIEYGEERIEISRILEKNSYNNDSQDIYATFVAEDLRFPKKEKPLFLISINNADNESVDSIRRKYEYIDGEYLYINTEKGFGKQSLRLFFELNDGDSSGQLKDFGFIDDEKYWGDDYSDNSPIESSKSFLSIIKEEDREITFSNLLQYALSFPEILKRFYGVLFPNGSNQFDFNNYNINVKREEHNIDLIIRDSKHIIIIENKIQSGINGIEEGRGDDTVRQQIEKALGIKEDDPVEDEPKENSKSKDKKDLCDVLLEDYKKIKNSSELIISQLSKYYFYSRWVAVKEGIDEKNIHRYILCPNYQFDKYDKYIQNYLYGEEYTVINYKQLYDSLKIYKDKYPYIDEFLKAMEKHTKEIDESKKEEVLSRFNKAMEDCKNGKD